MQLKVKRGKNLWLLPIKGEFTQKELQPYEKVMRREGISILQNGERVNVPLQTFDKAEILASFKAAQQNMHPTPRGRAGSAGSRVRNSKNALPAKSG